MSDEQVAPETRGVAVKVLATVDLTGEIEGMAGRQRARSRGALDRWISRRPVIDSDPNVSRIWGRLAAAAQLRGAWRSDNDLWVAACCLSQGLPLVTRNVKDFVAVVENHGLALITE